VGVKTCDLIGRDRETIHAVTMPGFGTSQRTRTNATRLMELLGVRTEDRDIRRLCLDTFVAMDYHPFGITPHGKSVEEFVADLARLGPNATDLTFENVQARSRTLLLMSWGFVLGTGDLSELALGWCTYNGDHMSMYNPNVSVPKTLVRFLVRWVADHEFSDEARSVLHSIADTEISPELLPISADQKIQSTEDTIGRYELHDFFLYYFLRFGYSPRKILYLASQARFDQDYTTDEVRKTLRTFLSRFFIYQFKRSCLPDGPKVGTVSLSPRGDWRMPSDAEAAAWLADLNAAN
jgi:NAD+ synthase (glutamine-hydrolysing)